MKKKILYIVLGIFILTFVYFVAEVSTYIVRQKQNESMIEYCSQNNTEDCYTRMFELMLPKLLLYNAKVEGSDVELIWFDPDTVRVDALGAILKSDALLGYGVYHTTGYEDKYSELFDKHSYAFDCGVKYFTPQSPKCDFKSECLASDDFLIFDHMFTKQMQTSSGKVHTLRQKMDELNLSDKKVFVKMDVDEGDIAVLPEIIKNADNITGFNIAFHIRDSKAIIDRLPILDLINEKFVLVSRHTYFEENNANSRIINSKYYKYIINSRIIYLSYINKKLINNYKISSIQNSYTYYNRKHVAIRNMPLSDIPLSDVSYVVTLAEKIKTILKGNKI